MQPESLDLSGRLMLRVDEVMTATGFSRATIYRLLMSGEIPSFVVGRSRRVSVEDLKRWIARQPRTESQVAGGDLLARRAYNRRSQTE